MFPLRGEKRIAVFITWFMKTSTVILLTMSSILGETVSTAFLTTERGLRFSQKQFAR